MISLFKDDKFKLYFTQFMIIFIVFIAVGIVCGYLMPHNVVQSTVSYVMTESVSGQMVHLSDTAFYKMLIFFVNNTLCACMLAIILPLLSRNHLTDVNNIRRTVLLSRIIVAFQAILIGVIIGYAIPIINNLSLIFMSLAPHGIVEIPAYLMAATIGVWMLNEQLIDYKQLLTQFVVKIIPLIFIAAIIEAYITPYLLTII